MPLHPKVLLQGDTPSAYSSYPFKIWDQVKKLNGVIGSNDALKNKCPAYYHAHALSYISMECKFLYHAAITFRVDPITTNIPICGQAAYITESIDPQSINLFYIASSDASYRTNFTFDQTTSAEQHPKMYLIYFAQVLQANGFYGSDIVIPEYSGTIIDNIYVSSISDALFSNIPAIVDFENDGYTYGVWQTEQAGLPPSFVWNYK